MTVAVAGEFSSLSLITYPANFLIPITRYLGFIWMLFVAVNLTRNRRPEQIQQTAPEV
jgi:threonine/homoserine/homoserine lactone efflux protein